jgi:hypothetical protein
LFFFGGLVYNYTGTKWQLKTNCGPEWLGNSTSNRHPLSSLIGWVEILKSENIAKVLPRNRKDIERRKLLQIVFQKIGSEPKLELTDIVDETQQS